MDTHYACLSCSMNENCIVQDNNLVEVCEIVSDYEHEMRQIQYEEYMKEREFYNNPHKFMVKYG